MPQIHLKLDQIPEEKPFRVDHEDIPVVIIRTGSKVVAYHDICPHAYWHLSDGEYRNGVLECPGHGWEFCTASGACHTVSDYRLKPFQVEVEGDHVCITWQEEVLIGNKKVRGK